MFFVKRIIVRLCLLAVAIQMGTPIGTRNAIAADPPRPGVRDTTRVRLGTGEGATDAFVAWPTTKDAAPAVIVIHEWWGLNVQIRSVARKLAQEGYVAIVPDLYHGKVSDDPELAHELSRGLDEARALADIDAAATWLRGQPRVVRAKIGIVGFCMGGRFSELYALRGKVAAAVMFYGRPETAPTALATLSGPLQAHFGGEDRGIGKDQVDALRAGLAKAGKAGEVFTYAGAGHAFMNDTRDSYHADAAKLAWARTLQLFQKHLKG